MIDTLLMSRFQHKWVNSPDTSNSLITTLRIAAKMHSVTASRSHGAYRAWRVCRSFLPKTELFKKKRHKIGLGIFVVTGMFKHIYSIFYHILSLFKSSPRNFHETPRCGLADQSCSYRCIVSYQSQAFTDFSLQLRRNWIRFFSRVQ